MVMLSDHSADTELAARLRAEYGLDQPIWRQFLSYFTHIARGDFHRGRDDGPDPGPIVNTNRPHSPAGQRTNGAPACHFDAAHALG